MKKRYVIMLLALLIGIIFAGRQYQQSQLNKLQEEALTTAVNREPREEIIETRPIYVRKNGNSISIRNKYNDEHDIEVQWAVRGSNNLFDYQSTSLIENTEATVSKGGGLTQVHTTSTDTFGPHRILALNNIDGDYTGETHFTGGNHSYDGNTGGTATGRTENINLIVDGEEERNFSGYADEIQIIWDNFIQASNTKLEDGTGREVAKETYSLTFNGEEYIVDYEIEFLEDVFWERYYGLQFSYRDSWNETIVYENADTEDLTYPISEYSTSGSQNTEKITLSDGVNYIDITLDNEVGLGTRDYLTNTEWGAFNIANNNKIYYYLVDGVNMTAGEIANYKGTLKFYSE